MKVAVTSVLPAAECPLLLALAALGLVTSDSRGDFEVNLVSKFDTSSSLVSVGTKGGS